MENESAVLQKGNPLGYLPIGKLLKKFALPSVVAMLVNAIYNIVDQIFIGQGIGYLGNAATTVAFPVVSIVLAVSTLFGAGGSAYAAIKMGEKKEKEAQKTLGNVFIILIIVGVIVAALGLIFLEPVLRVFGATDNNIGFAKDYTWIILLGTPFSMLGVGLSNLARTDGAPKLSMYSIVAGAVLNTILDPIYIFVFHWGVTGAAIATTTSQIISAVVLVWYFLKRGNMRLTRESMKLSGTVCKNAFMLGISSCILQFASVLLQITMNNSLVYYGNKTSVTGDVALSAMGIVMKLSMILISICIGIGVGAQPILGFNRGARQYRRVKKTYQKAAAIATIVSVAGWALCLLIPHIILMLFGEADQNFTDFAVKSMRIFLGGVFCAGFQIVSTNYFQATGQPIKATVLSTLRQLLFLIPLILLMPLWMGLDGILVAGPIADIMAAAVTAVLIAIEMKKLNRLIKETEGEASAAVTA